MNGQVGQQTLDATCWLYSRVGLGTIDFRLQFSAKSLALLSVAQVVSPKCVA